MSKIWRRLTRGGTGDERGAILILSTVGVVLAVVAAALAVDLGTLAQERRRIQKVADLAALDAVRDVPANYDAKAKESAVRNGFPVAAGYNVVAVEGTKTGGTCVPSAGAGKACVTVTAPHKNDFLAGNQIVVARAVAGPSAQAGFWMGSSLLSASLDNATENLPLLNRVFGRWLGGPTGQASVVSYKGLADTSVQLRQLQAALGFGTPNELFNTNITMGQLLHATGVVLNNQGTAAALSAYNDIIRLENTTTSTAQFKLGDFLKVSQGYENKALDGSINVFELITGGAQVANKNNLIDAGTVIHLPIDYLAPIADVTADATLKLKVIEGPKHYFGPVGGSATTSQIEVTLGTHVDVGSNLVVPTWLLNLLSISGSEGLHIIGDVTAKYTAGGATGTLSAIRCANPNQGITVSVVSQPLTTHVEGTASIYDSSILSFITGNVKVNVSFSPPDVSTPVGGPYAIDLAYPNDYAPNDPDGKSTPGTPVGITLGEGNVSTSAGAAGLLNTVLTTLKLEGANSVEAAIINPILNPVLNAVANHLTTPALKALGVSLGPVDVWASIPDGDFDPAGCGQPGLLG